MSFQSAMRSSASAMFTRAAPRNGFVAARPALTSSILTQRRLASGDDVGPNKTHTTDKPAHDVQADASSKAQDAHNNAANDNSSSATSRKDENKSNQRAKDDFPEAPDVVIGMNDERGGKGH